MSARRADDPSIADEEILWRRVAEAHILSNPSTGGARPSSAVFCTDEMSVHIASLTSTPAVLRNYPGFRIAALCARDVRAEGLIIVRDPTPDAASHALICRNEGGRISKSQAKRLANRATWVE